MASPYKAKRETPFTRLGAVSGRSTRIGFKVMKDKKPGQVTTPELTDVELAELLARVGAKCT